LVPETLRAAAKSGKPRRFQHPSSTCLFVASRRPRETMAARPDVYVLGGYQTDFARN
jgi:hypothetical protein